MPSTHKKVVVCKLDRDSVQGYVNPTAFVSGGRLEMLNTAGQVVTLDLADVKGVYFVREFADPGSVAARKTFATRPRAEGLWVRMRFRDNEVMEGLMPNDLMQVSAEGYLVTPPDTRSNTQRIFVPRTALLEMSVLAVIGGRAAARRRTAAADARQVPMFSE
ncbi:MAG TPA: hypothetical protein VNK82_10820 [Terriglobales bacterium]|nr:hypothetical protein [Terriglobales bacterium]